MCGIAGVFFKAGSPPEIPLEPIRHRGPDGSGTWRSPDGRCVLGHTRLAILDLSPAGAQPMTDPETGNTIVFNGEIYNHRALRAQLGGAAWRGTSDTETLLAGYRRWGAGLLEKIKGMFAFAIYDAAEASLLLVRDRLGIKPLYFAENAEGLRFCSELRPLLSAGLSREMIAEYLRWGYCPEEQTFVAGLAMFPAGHWAKFRDGAGIERASFWPLQTIPPRPAAGVAEAIRRRLETAVEEHLLSDVPVASFLSGGIDSSVVTALAAKTLGRRLKTFAIGFPEKHLDETGVAAQVAKRYGTDHCRIEVGHEEAQQLVMEAVERMDCPSIDAVNTYIISRKVAGQGIKVALSGLGGDELFGGYPSFRDVPKLRRFARLPGWLRAWWPGRGSERLREIPSPNVAALARWRRVVCPDAELLRAGLPVPPFEALPAPGLPDAFAVISWQELAGYMRAMLLRDSDQMSMAVALEIRVPLLDHELVEEVLGLPEESKRRGGRPKGLLIEACRDLLPAEVYDRDKMGFSLPMDAWMRGPLREFCQTGLQGVTNAGVLARDFVSRTASRFERHELHWSRLWALVVLGRFLSRRA